MALRFSPYTLISFNVCGIWLGCKSNRPKHNSVSAIIILLSIPIRHYLEMGPLALPTCSLILTKGLVRTPNTGLCSPLCTFPSSLMPCPTDSNHCSFSNGWLCLLRSEELPDLFRLQLSASQLGNCPHGGDWGYNGAYPVRFPSFRAGTLPLLMSNMEKQLLHVFCPVLWLFMMGGLVGESYSIMARK